MDFFESQDSHRRESSVMLLAFVSVFLICFGIIYWLAKVAALGVVYFIPELFPGTVTLFFIGVMGAVIGSGCYRRWCDISDGGEKLAIRMGATPVDQASSKQEDRQLLNLVSEMAVAANVPTPTSYCLRNELSINAFIAGTSDCTVLIVTQGLLNELDKDETLAVVAHEIGHIVNKDLIWNMRLLVALSGLNAITDAGFAFFDLTQYKHNHGYSKSGSDTDTGPEIFLFILALVVGGALCVLGAVFTFFGNILKAAFSRKREYLADARAVQFTRKTWGLASALNKISTSDAKRGLRSRYYREVSHLCIDSPASDSIFPALMATHPAVQNRITKLEPHFKVKLRQKTDRQHDKTSTTGNRTNRTTISPDTRPATDYLTLNECAAELSILLSMVIQSSGYNHDASKQKHEDILRSYTSESFPMRSASDVNAESEFEEALDKLVKLPALQRQNLLDHIAEIVEHDGMELKKEKMMIQYVNARLNPKSNAA